MIKSLETTGNMSEQFMRSHCSERNYEKIAKYITNNEIGGTVNFEYQILAQVHHSSGEFIKEPMVVFTFSYGNNSDNLSKVTRFMKVLGETHV